MDQHSRVGKQDTVARSLARTYVRYVHRGGVNLFGRGGLVPVCFQESFTRSTQELCPTVVSTGGERREDGGEGGRCDGEEEAGKVDALAL